MKLILASGNKGKHREFAEFFSRGGVLGQFGVELISAADIDGARDILSRVDENGTTYEENALIKARALSDVLGTPTISDDSGIEVQAMGMAPGIRSARAVQGTDEDRVRWMLSEMSSKKTPDARRAWFVACLVIAFPSSWGDVPGGRHHFSVEGRSAGHLALEPRGTGGFGYDPIFIPDGYDRTYSEIAPEEKARISHRARAVSALAKIMPDVIIYNDAHKK